MLSKFKEAEPEAVYQNLSVDSVNGVFLPTMRSLNTLQE